MADVLPRLRLDLSFMPSPSAQQPGLLIQDPHQFSDLTLVIPPQLVELLGLFDGETPRDEARVHLVRATQNIEAGTVLDHLFHALDEAGFLDNDRSRALIDAKVNAFLAAPTRLPAHLGPGGYPADLPELRATFDDYFREAVPPRADGKVWGIAAPHVSPMGGWRSYRDAYHATKLAVGDRAADLTFVVLGTSHSGEPHKFGLTRKPYETPWGVTTPALDLIEELETRGGDAVIREDFCHAREHSIEFQIAFLQYLFGANVRVLPILCGPFSESILAGTGRPEDDEAVARFFETLGEIHAREKQRLFYVLGVDMAHVGMRYGDGAPVVSGQGDAIPIAQRDHDRMNQMAAGSSLDFWGRVLEQHDDLKWCGSSPIYTFLKACPEARGDLLRYEQWNIDPESIVSFAAMRFGDLSATQIAKPPSTLLVS